MEIETDDDGSRLRSRLRPSTHNQAILYKISETFGVTFERASSVATLMQAGYAAGLLFICPLGDIFQTSTIHSRPGRFHRDYGELRGRAAPGDGPGWRFRGNMLTDWQWLGLCVTSSFEAFSAISFICGATTVTPQLMLPLVGDLAPAHRRASSLAIVVSGLSLGMLIARILSGILANYTDWRNIYWFAFGAQFLILALLYVWLPDYPSKNPEGLNYFKMLWTVVCFFFTEPLLAQASLMSLPHECRLHILLDHPVFPAVLAAVQLLLHRDWPFRPHQCRGHLQRAHILPAGH